MKPQSYDVHQKLEAVERAMGLCKRVARSMITQGQMTQGEVSKLFDVMKQVGFDYQSQAFEQKKQTRSSCSSLPNSPCSDTFTSHRVD